MYNSDMEAPTAISALLLIVSTILCGLLFVFSLSERHSQPRRALIILLGSLTLWYLLLTGMNLRALNLLPWAAVVKRPLYFFGIMRPGFILVFAALAHCYVQAARAAGQQVTRWMRPASIYLITFVSIVLIRLFMPDRLNNRPLAAVIALFSLLIPVYTIAKLHFSLGRARPTRQTRSVGNIVWPLSFLLSFVLMSASFYHTLTIGNATRLYDSLALVSILPLIFWLIYYHTPFLFIDVLVKRGAQVLLFALLFGAYLGAIAYFGGYIGERSYWFYLLCAFVTSLPAAMITRLSTVLDRFIDTKLLGRSHFQDMLLELNNRLNRAANSELATSQATELIKCSVAASEVRFSLELPKESEQLVVPVKTAEESFGYLIVGPALNRSRYLSEDQKFISLVASSLAATMTRLRMETESQQRRMRELELVSTANELKLKALQSQLDPHFLFNSMSLIGSLVRYAPDKARDAVQRLASVYRYVLDSSKKELVAVSEEINFLKDYLAIEQLRFESRLRVNFDLCAGLENEFIPPMLLQPLVENGLKHGLSPKLEGGELSLAVARAGDGLLFTVSDSGVGFDASKAARTDSGVGLANLRQQLAIRYRADLIITATPGQGTQIQFTLPSAQPQTITDNTELTSAYTSTDR